MTPDQERELCDRLVAMPPPTNLSHDGIALVQAEIGCSEADAKAIIEGWRERGLIASEIFPHGGQIDQRVAMPEGRFRWIRPSTQI
jgi:hypothetical protein